MREEANERPGIPPTPPPTRQPSSIESYLSDNGGVTETIKDSETAYKCQASLLEITVSSSSWQRP